MRSLAIQPRHEALTFPNFDSGVPPEVVGGFRHCASIVRTQVKAGRAHLFVAVDREHTIRGHLKPPWAGHNGTLGDAYRARAPQRYGLLHTYRPFVSGSYGDIRTASGRRPAGLMATSKVVGP